jgi:putative NADPH-quinone reductase
MCLARAYVDELAARGHQHTLHDLYRLEFDPVLTETELVQAKSRSS